MLEVILLKKKLLALFIIIIGLFTLIKVSAKENTKAAIVSTGGANLNVRVEASTSSKIKTKLSDSSYFTIISSKNNFYYIEYLKNSYGYVHKDYVKIISQDEREVKTGGANLNVRSGPSTNYSIITKLKDKESVIVLETKNSWSKILYNGNNIGYVSATYLSNNYKYSNINLNVISFKQYDSRWANNKIGLSGKTFKEIGCLTTSMAMVESFRRGQTLTPLYYETVSSYTPDGSLYWPSRYKFITTNNLDTLYNMLKSGKPVIVGRKKANGSQHFVVVYGCTSTNSLSSSSFLIRDPGSSTRTTLKEFERDYPIFYKMAYYSY